MKGYEYASFVKNTCMELHTILGTVPVVSNIYKQDALGGEWRNILCHPEDKGKTDKAEFKHPYRDI